ncbi:unnamed protein product, partial [Rotaria sp. Silwood2]
MIGAKITATAGTEGKRKFLREKYQIEHVFNSRNLSFVKDVRRVAPNGVVDIIVNTLSDIFIEQSLKLLAPLSHFIELGKHDMYANSKLSLFSLRTSCNFHVVDIVTLQKYFSQKIHIFLNDIANLCFQQNLTPTMPIIEFEASGIQHAFLTYSQATHIGKLVVNIAASHKSLQLPNDYISEQTYQQRQNAMFSTLVCNHGIIVISGGLGGLAIDISKWMLKERDVKRIVLLSRNINELDNQSSQYNNWINLEQL